MVHFVRLLNKTPWQPADLPEGTNLSTAINQTFMQVGVFQSVTLKWGVDTQDNGNVPKSPPDGMEGQDKRLHSALF